MADSTLISFSYCLNLSLGNHFVSPSVGGGMKEEETWRFEIPFSSGGFSSKYSA
jgi:hypothetical protein